MSAWVIMGIRVTLRVDWYRCYMSELMMAALFSNNDAVTPELAPVKKKPGSNGSFRVCYYGVPLESVTHLVAVCIHVYW